MSFNAKIKNEGNIVQAIMEWYSSKSYGPSFRDLAKMTGMSLGTVYNVCTDLRDAGVIDFQEGVARTIRMKGSN